MSPDRWEVQTWNEVVTANAFKQCVPEGSILDWTSFKYKDCVCRFSSLLWEVLFKIISEKYLSFGLILCNNPWSPLIDFPMQCTCASHGFLPCVKFFFSSPFLPLLQDRTIKSIMKLYKFLKKKPKPLLGEIKRNLVCYLDVIMPQQFQWIITHALV